MNHPNGQLDTSIEIVTPENIAFRYRVAGPFRRLPAFLIDMVICTAILIATLIAVSTALSWLLGAIGLGGLEWGLFLVLAFLLVWFYGGVFETLWNGQTPGKRLMQIRVLSIDGQPINAMQAVLRNVLRSVDMQPVVFCQVGLWAAMMNDRFQRLGDLACGTMVVIEEGRWLHGLVRVHEPGAIQLAARIPAGFQPGRSLARALAGYVERRRHIVGPRRLEIAGHLGEPLRRRFNLPAGTNLDHLLCGLYYRTFITDRDDESAAGDRSPFGPPAPVAEPPSPFARPDEIPVVAQVIEAADSASQTSKPKSK